MCIRISKQLWNRRLIFFAPYIGVSLLIIILPILIPSYFLGKISEIFIFTIFAMSLNLVFGYTGLFSLGQAAFFGVGAYTAGILTLRQGIQSFWLTAPAGILMAVILAAVLGLIIFRFSGVYFFLVTFAIGQLVFSIAWVWVSMTRGDSGLIGIPRPEIGLPWSLGSESYFYYFVLMILIICFFLLYRIVGSPLGRAFVGIRENESRMRALGYNTWLYKYISFILGAVFAGLAGVLIAYHRGVVFPQYMDVTTSALVLIMVILGGAGMFYGPLIGAMVILLAEYFFGMYIPERWELALGIIFVLCVIYARGGLSRHLAKLYRRAEHKYGSPKS